MTDKLDDDKGFLLYVDLHCETELALFSRSDVLRLMELARVRPGSYYLPERSFIGVHADVAKPLIERARKQLKRHTPQLELPFDSKRGAEDFLL